MDAYLLFINSKKILIAIKKGLVEGYSVSKAGNFELIEGNYGYIEHHSGYLEHHSGYLEHHSVFIEGHSVLNLVLRSIILCQYGNKYV